MICGGGVVRVEVEGLISTSLVGLIPVKHTMSCVDDTPDLLPERQTLVDSAQTSPFWERDAFDRALNMLVRCLCLGPNWSFPGLDDHKPSPSSAGDHDHSSVRRAGMLCFYSDHFDATSSFSLNQLLTRCPGCRNIQCVD